MVNIEKIVLNEPIYYTPKWSGVTRISVTEIVNDNSVLVQVPQNKKGKKFKPFYMSPRFIFTEHEHAERAKRDWKEHMQKRNKRKRESK